MKCFSLALLVGLAAAAAGVRAQETSPATHWSKSEIRFYRLDSESDAGNVRAGTRTPIAALGEQVEESSGGRLDNFYPGTPPEPSFDEARLDDFYPEGADAVGQRVQRTKGGLIASSLVMGIGLGLIGGAAAAAGATEYSEIMPAAGLVLGGSILVIPGVVGVGICGKRFRSAKKERSTLQH